MLLILRLLHGFLTMASGLSGLALGCYLYLNDRELSWELRLLTSAALGLVCSGVVLFLAIKTHELEQALRRPRSRPKYRAGVVDWGTTELPSLR